MDNTVHITNGDSAGGMLAKSGLPGDVFVRHDILYDGPRCPGWPDEDTLKARAVFVRKESETYVLDSKKTLKKNKRTDLGRIKPKRFIEVKVLNL